MPLCKAKNHTRVPLTDQSNTHTMKSVKNNNNIGKKPVKTLKKNSSIGKENLREDIQDEKLKDIEGRLSLCKQTNSDRMRFRNPQMLSPKREKSHVSCLRTLKSVNITELTSNSSVDSNQPNVDCNIKPLKVILTDNITVEKNLPVPNVPNTDSSNIHFSHHYWQSHTYDTSQQNLDFTLSKNIEFNGKEERQKVELESHNRTTDVQESEINEGQKLQNFVRIKDLNYESLGKADGNLKNNGCQTINFETPMKMLNIILKRTVLNGGNCQKIEENENVVTINDSNSGQVFNKKGKAIKESGVRNLFKETNKVIGNCSIMPDMENISQGKELVVNIYRLIQNPNNVLDKATNNMNTKEPNVVVSLQKVESNQKINFQAKENIIVEKSDKKLSKKLVVTLKKFDKEPDDLLEKDNHNLRKLVPKNYVEDSTLDYTKNNSKLKIHKNDSVPIYRRVFPEEIKQINENNDLYEFDDFSPKTKQHIQKKRPHRSSILFDKDTHEIMQKIEEKEEKNKKKIIRRKKKINVISENRKSKSYEKIVNDILSNVMKKVKKNVALYEGNNNFREKVQNLVTTTALIHNSSAESNKEQEKIIKLNNFDQETDVIAPRLSNVLCNTENVPQHLNCAKNHPSVSRRSVDDYNLITTLNCENSNNSFDAFPGNYDRPQNFEISDACITQNDIDSCFGFDNENEAPISSTPVKLTNKPNIKILSNIPLRNERIESPVNFHSRGPNANSTMLNFARLNKSGSPWRMQCSNLRANPHFVSIKPNAMPRIDQDMVLEHTLVEEFESMCSKTPKKYNKLTPKKSPVQQSILDFVESNVEKENVPVHGSLFDIENFNSPVKKSKKITASAEGVKRNILGAIQDGNIVEIGAIETTHTDLTYFGFGDNSKQTSGGCENNAKPSRFDVSALRKYSSKKNKKKEISSKDVEVQNEENEDISLVEVSNDAETSEPHLFEDPEDILDNTSPVIVGERRHRRKRLDSINSDTSESGRNKRKRHKKTKLEIDQEKWIEEFNNMCEEIDRYELELE